MTEFVFIIAMAYGSYADCEAARARFDLLDHTEMCFVREQQDHAPHTSIRPKARGDVGK